MTPLSQDTLDAYEAHKHVNVTQSPSRPHLSSISFAKSAFYGQHWDAITTRARGLFIDNRTRAIVARGYNKFFNLNEREETQLDEVLESFTLPVTAWHKYNGFLGVTGYDESTGELLVCSKSRVEGDFADYFRAILETLYDEGTRERLRRALRDLGASAIFEVIDPVNDPHIVEYGEPMLVLLDVVRRHAPEDGSNPDKLDYDELKEFAAHVGGSAKNALPVKEKIAAFKDRNTLEKFINGYISPARERRIEGIVLEDANGNIVKLKTVWYSHWKRARAHVNRFVECHDKQVPFDAKVEPEHAYFMKWAMARPIDLLRHASIIQLRNAYQNGEDIDHIVENQQKAAADLARLIEERKEEERQTKLEAQINTALTAIATQVDKGRGKRESVEKLFARGENNPVIQAAIDAHPDIEKLRNFLTLPDPSAR